MNQKIGTRLIFLSFFLCSLAELLQSQETPDYVFEPIGFGRNLLLAFIFSMAMLYTVVLPKFQRLNHHQNGEDNKNT